MLPTCVREHVAKQLPPRLAQLGGEALITHPMLQKQAGFVQHIANNVSLALRDSAQKIFV